MATFAEYLADVAAGMVSCDWPIFVATSFDQQVVVDDTIDPGQATVGDGAAPVFSEYTARRFLDHQCVYTTRPASAERLTIGRRSGNDYRLGHASVSGSHAALIPGPGGAVQIVDTDSRNGTFVSNRQLEPGVPADVPPNALLHFGSAGFYWVEPQMARTLARVAR